MAFNITLGALILTSSTVPVFAAILISIRGYLKRGYTEYLYMLLTWIFLWFGNLLIGISYLTLDTVIYRIGIAASGPLLFGIVFLVDSISRDSIDPRKVLIATSVSTALGVFATEPDAVTLNVSALGEMGLAMTGNFALAGSITFLIAGLFWLYYMTMIHIRAPKHLKKYSTINLLGAILAGPGSAGAFASGLVWFLPGTDYFLIGLGALLTAFAFTKQPKLAYVLPFNVYRLIALDLESGIPLYTYTWNETGLMDSTLFTGALTGVNSLLKESLGQGAMKYIAFQQGVLLIKYIPEMDVGFTLIASKSSEILRHALNLFAEAFVREFREKLEADRGHVSQFSEATYLIHDRFPFVVGVEPTTTPLL